MTSNRTIIATTTIYRDGLHWTALLGKDGELTQWIESEGCGSASLQEREEAIPLAMEWGIYYIPNYSAVDQDRFDKLRSNLRSIRRAYYFAIGLLRVWGGPRCPVTRAECEANPGSHQTSGAGYSGYAVASVAH